MKKIISVIVISLVCAVAMNSSYGQTSTYILLRHAEKDTSITGSTAMKADPPLSKEGEQRAQRLPEVLKAYQPDAVYSTNYARTKATVTPVSKKFGKEIQLYDPKNLAAFAEQLLQEKGKTIIVAGHSNTTPALVNLLIKENKYPAIDDSVYDQLWIVTITDGKASAKVLKY
jgi:2,3-bisphosphoglycerate-dependent phosphoglycerate mutase